MLTLHSLFSLFFSISAIILFSPSISAWDSLTDNIDIRCEQLNMSLECHYRPLFPGSVTNIYASSGNLDLPVEENPGNTENLTAIFFLIDTSDPGRQNVINKNIRQIEKLVNASTGFHRLGLASFDKKLRILAPLGSAKNQVISSARKIKAEGRTTELYRNLLLTIEKLSRSNAGRKAIYLFSDGQAEDKAYFHTDVVRAARRKGIIINSIGFPRSISLSVALQTLRRLSEETGGSFTEANNNYELDKSFYTDAFRNIDAGKDIAVDLTSLIESGFSSANKISLDFSTDIGRINIQVPVSLPKVTTAIAPLPRAAEIVVTPAPVQPTVRMLSPVSEPDKINVWLWYGLPVALVLLFTIALITLILIYRKQPDKTVFAKNDQPQARPFAYLISQDEEARRYPILTTTWRIGRSRDNELTLDDNSVSRLHAEIHRHNNGSFFIMDMQSLNGVYVNEEQVSNRKLEEGDIIEIGDIYLRFTLYAEDYQLEDNTAVQKTKVPAH